MSVRVGDTQTAYKRVETAACIFQAAIRGGRASQTRHDPRISLIARVLFCGIGLLERDKRYKDATRLIGEDELQLLRLS
eukprot:753154-Hanusia_phi.AAC.7